MYLIERLYRETDEGRETIKQFLKTLFNAKVPVALQNGNATEITTKRLRRYRDKQVQTIKSASSGLDKEKKSHLYDYAPVPKAQRQRCIIFFTLALEQ